MRKGFTRFAMLMLVIFSASGIFAQGGPDAYGYTYRTSNDTVNGPVYAWKEIVGIPGATEITGLLDDNSVGPFSLGWDFHYYWTDVSAFKFGSNGWVGFNNISNIAHCFPTIPTAGGAGDNFLAPFMTDLSFEGVGNIGQVWYYDNGVDSLIIQWQNAAWWQQAQPTWVGDNTFQLILNGQDSTITFQYKQMSPLSFNNTGGCANDLEIGIENITGNIGLEALNETVPDDQFVIRFYPPAVVTFQVPDATPNWVANPDNAGQFIYSGAFQNNFSANIKNVGNAAITNNISVTAVIGGGILNSNTSIAGGLVQGDDSTVVFPAAAVFPNPGNYILNVTTASSQDINPSNNAVGVEVVAVECLNDSINLGYFSGTQPDGVIAWGGGSGNEGAGIYVIPPSYPATVEAVDVFIADIDQDPLLVDAYSIVIYDGNGQPGAVLDSVFVPANQIVENTWARIQMNSTAVINSGGFYVGWIQSAGNVALGTESLAPLSRRTFEIIGGGWSGYRNSTVEDFLMSAHMSTVCLVGNSKPKDSNLSVSAVPNPSNGTTNFELSLPTVGDMNLRLVDLQGKVVFATSRTGLNAGLHTVSFNANTVPAGVYFVQVEQNGERVNSKFVVTR